MEDKEEEDRISQLPDAILQHIISFIDIKQAVQTTILSTRWQNLWFSLSDLDFSLTRLATHSRVSLKNRQASQDFSLLFAQFVDHFLSHRDHTSTVRNFRLSFDSRHHVHVDAPFVEKCIDYAINHGVQALRLEALCRPVLRFPDSFFASNTLRELELRQFAYGIHMPKQFSLPHLKTLFLENSAFMDDGDVYSFSKEPFSGFPELEKLTLHRCSIYGLVVSAPKLRFLEIIQEKLYSQVMGKISGSRLTSFRYEGYFPLECSKINVPMLEDVYLNIYKKVGRFNTLRDKWMPLKCVRMLQQLGDAKIVTLTMDTVKVLEMDRRLIEQSPSPFTNMKCLKLRKGRREIPTVLQRVMNYLTEGSIYGDESLMVEFPEGVCVVERNLDDLFDEESDEHQLEQLFGIEDETPSQLRNFGVFEELLLPKFGQDGRVTF
ncbi:hypothetical protein C2S51_007992 [Perilla frutescens var. frutescens]|nr:hypothetical protein C2S51_007992 [Perilla frutescens var. frutescens]